MEMSLDHLLYLLSLAHQYASGGEVSAPITGPHTITAADLIGVAAFPAQTMGAYTDAGGQKIAAPFVTSMANGYPVYALPSTASQSTAPLSDIDRIKNWGHHNWMPFEDPANRALEIASAMNTGVQNG